MLADGGEAIADLSGNGANLQAGTPFISSGDIFKVNSTTPTLRASMPGSGQMRNTTAICDRRGTPLKVITTAANVNDVTRTLALVDGIPPVAGRPGRPRRRLPARWQELRLQPQPRRAP